MSNLINFKMKPKININKFYSDRFRSMIFINESNKLIKIEKYIKVNESLLT